MGFGVSFRFIQIVFEVILTTLTGVTMWAGTSCGFLRILIVIYFSISLILTLLIMGLFCVVGMKKGPKALYKQLIGESYLNKKDIDKSINNNNYINYEKCLPKQKNDNLNSDICQNIDNQQNQLKKKKSQRKSRNFVIDEESEVNGLLDSSL
ncbi:hypothetical protein PPERSA_12273 [Pseudocohnilembus persalinus]|uniref:Uncharacterized protein n=1 Tax=Pseudocohnilembus persalinus TaxID=266149 RepID=A0A0V0R564_PSEPJ|nr:hypothetical protein PPERSA_12273 [Pseudocohnilembus persalinus]|eukprot:KRX09530.1 hypothetical protein PPERSA_12273 [Pseudocohnilembus persalinus]